ncbi:hypothetical protein FDB25_06475 [Clostridium botulinum]|nr:hypothetical protein [Clostridium botulinum]
MNDSSDREYWIDNIKAILIYLVITGHFAILLVDKSKSMLIYSQFISIFYMPAFMIITGYLSKRRINEKRYGDIIERIFFPYIICNFIMFIIFQSRGISKVSGIDQTEIFIVLQPYYFFGFLLAIFIFNIITPLLAKNGQKVHIIIAVVLSLLCGYGKKVNYMWLSKMIPFYIYFTIEYYLKLERINLFLKHKVSRFFFYCIFDGCIFYMH